jgi:flagellar M-ring protein FliF
MPPRAFDSARLSDATSRARQFIAGFTPGQKAVTVASGLALVIGGYLFISHSSSPSYTTLYSNLQASQAGQVTQALTTAHIPYELQDNGATVAVPASDVNQERIDLAEAGLPSGGTITFQTLASTGITSSEFVQNVDYQEALEGQLDSTIESIQGISSAQVSLALPTTSNSFAIGTTQAPTASVLVDLNAGATLSSNQVQGISNLVASSVPGLDANSVTVVDNDGDVLSSGGASDTADSDSAQTVAYDSQLAASLSALVEKVVGPNNAAVQVHALLNFNQQKTTTNGFQVGPNGKPITAPTSTNSQTTSYSGNGAQAAGVLTAGATSSPTTGTTSSTTGTNGTYSSTQTQTTTAVGEVTQTIDQAPGQVETTAVAVLLNSRAVKSSQIPTIRNLVMAAAGLNLKSGDTIAVSALPFSPVKQPAVAKKASIMTGLEKDAPDAAVLALILALFFFSLRSSKRRASSFEEIPLQQLALGRAPIELESGESSSLERLRPRALSASPAPLTSDLDNFIESSPEEITQLMRAWASERAAKTAD